MAFNKVNEIESYSCTLHIAGSYDVAVQVAKEFSYNHGICFQITKTQYVYTGGTEDGMTVRLIAYPRFPKPSYVILSEMETFAEILAEKLCQKSYTIEDSTSTKYYESTNPLHKK